MAFLTHHLNKKTGSIYVYETVSTWDKEKKQSRNKQVCIGKLDNVTNEVIPNKSREVLSDPTSPQKGITATTQIYGPYLVLEFITKELSMEKRLKKCFPDSYKKLLSIVYYLVHRGTALCRFEHWAKAHKHPYNDILTSQEMSSLLLDQKEDDRQTFFKDWRDMFVEKEYLCYDLTSVSSYSKQNEYVAYGYNRDKEDLPQINLAMLFGQKSLLPAYYKRLPGNIPDVRTLFNLLKTMNYLDYKQLNLVLDKGFYSEDNLNALFDGNHKFTIGVSVHLMWVQKIIDEYSEQILLPDRYHKIDDEVLYVQTKLYRWGIKRKRSYLHMFFNAHRAASAHDTFMEKLLTCKQELENNQKVKVNETYYTRYFIIKETPVRGLSVAFNNEAILKFRKQYAGFFVLFTNDFKDPMTTLSVYRNKDVVENCFDDLKNQLDMKRLRVHSSSSMDSRLFIQFLSLIYISSLRQLINANASLQYLSVRELLECMETYVKVSYPGRYGAIYTELTKQQNMIIDALKICTPT